MDEGKERAVAVREQVVEALGLETASGRLKVRWDGKAQAKALGQMAFFIGFLTVTGLFDQWVATFWLTTRVPTDRAVATYLDVDAVDSLRALALRTCERDPRRRGQSPATEKECSGG